jgi:hypothetical protein
LADSALYRLMNSLIDGFIDSLIYRCFNDSSNLWLCQFQSTPIIVVILPIPVDLNDWSDSVDYNNSHNSINFCWFKKDFQIALWWWCFEPKQETFLIIGFPMFLCQKCILFYHWTSDMVVAETLENHSKVIHNYSGQNMDGS